MSTQNSRPTFSGGSDHEGGEAGASGELDARVGFLIRSRRTGMGLSVERLAEALGVTAPRLIEWESGVRRVGAEHLRLVSEILGVHPEAFFENDYAESIFSVHVPQRPEFRTGSPTPTVEECVRLVRAFRVITDPEARDAILALVVALSPDPTSQN